MLLDDGVRTQHQHEEENYFVSTTDMLVGILFIFIIMLMAFALNYKDAQQDRQKQIADVRKAIESVEREVTALQQQDRQRVELLRQLEQRLKEQGITVKIDLETGVLRLPEEVLFGRDQYALSERGRVALGHVARALDAVLPCYSGRESVKRPSYCSTPADIGLDAVFIEGHTDRTGSESHNWDLSAKRAIATYLELQRAAPPIVELENGRGQRLLSVSGYAFHRPADPSLLDPNRRIDIRFIMAVSYERALSRIRRQLQDMLAQQ